MADKDSRNQRMLNLTMEGLVAAGRTEISCGCLFEDDSTVLACIAQDEPDTIGLRFGFGTITLFDDGTWKLDE